MNEERASRFGPGWLRKDECHKLSWTSVSLYSYSRRWSKNWQRIHSMRCICVRATNKLGVQSTILVPSDNSHRVLVPTCLLKSNTFFFILSCRCFFRIRMRLRKSGSIFYWWTEKARSLAICEFVNWFICVISSCPFCFPLSHFVGLGFSFDGPITTEPNALAVCSRPHLYYPSTARTRI